MVRFWKLPLVLVAFVLVFGAANPVRVQAIFNNTPPAQTGFPVSLTGAGISDSSPTLADLLGDGKLEIVVGGQDLNGSNPGCGGWVYAYKPNGALLWQTHVRAPVNASPTVADLYGDGRKEVVVGMGGVVSGQCWNGGVIALNGMTGAEIWHFDTQDWLGERRDGMLDGVYSSPLVADLDGSGKPVIVFGAWDQCIYELDSNGVPLWGNLPGAVPGVYCGGHGYYIADTSWSSPAAADLQGDGKMEIVIGGDISPGNVWNDPAGGYIFVFDKAGNTLARRWVDQTVYSSPAIADLDKDGKNEIVVGSGTYWQGTGYNVKVFNYDPSQSDVRNRLVPKWTLPTRGRVYASPALGDLNLDGFKDIVVTSMIGDWGNSGSEVYAWSGRDGSQLFRTAACDEFGNSFAIRSSPTIADIVGDSHPEVLFSHAWEVGVLNWNGTHYTDYSGTGAPGNSTCARGTPPSTSQTYWTGYSVFSSPAVGDLDGNGQSEVVIGGAVDVNNPNKGRLYAWTGHKNGSREWPMFHHDPAHTGRFDTVPPVNPSGFSSAPFGLGGRGPVAPITVNWSVPGSDSDSGLSGYASVWDQNPATTPASTIDLSAAVTSSTNNVLQSGNWYFHIRSVDKVGNLAPVTAHVGPFTLTGGTVFNLFLPLLKH